MVEEMKSRINWIKVSGIIGFVLVGLLALSFILGLFGVSFEIPEPVSIALAVIALVANIVYYYGFFSLGKKVDSKLLRVAAILSIIGMAILTVLVIIALIGNYAPTDSIVPSSPFETTSPESNTLGTILGYFFLAFFVYLIVIRFLFSISLIIVGPSAKFSRTAGSLGIVLMGIFTLVLLWFLYKIFFDKLGLLMFIFTLAFDKGKQMMMLWSFYAWYMVYSGACYCFP